MRTLMALPFLSIAVAVGMRYIPPVPYCVVVFSDRTTAVVPNLTAAAAALKGQAGTIYLSAGDHVWPSPFHAKAEIRIR